VQSLHRLQFCAVSSPGTPAGAALRACLAVLVLRMHWLRLATRRCGAGITLELEMYRNVECLKATVSRLVVSCMSLQKQRPKSVFVLLLGLLREVGPAGW
jgi:hypothetical protein